MAKESNQYAYIAYSDGTRCGPFFAKESAVMSAMHLHQEEEILGHTLKTLCEEIMASKLPSKVEFRKMLRKFLGRKPRVTTKPKKATHQSNHTLH